MCKDTDIFRIFASYFVIDIIMSIDNTLKVRVQHAVIGTGDGDTSTDSTPKKGEIVFNSTLDNFRVGDGTTVYSLLSDVVKKYNLTLNDTIEGDTGGTSLGTLYAPTSKGTSGQYLRSTGNGAPAWSSLPEYSLGILAGTAAPINRIQLKKSQGTTSLGTWNVEPKLYFKNNSSASGIGDSVDIRLYAGDNITFTEINETVAEGDAARSGIKIDANVTTIPKATTASLGGIKLKSNTTIPSVKSPISSGNAYPIQLTSEGVAGVVFSTTELVGILNQLVDEARNNPSLRTQLASFFTGLTNITEQAFKDAMGAAFNTILSWYRTQS